MKINVVGIGNRMTTPIEEMVCQKLKVRTGMVTVSDGKSKPQSVRLHLSMEVLRLQKQPPAQTTPVITKPLNSKVSSILYTPNSNQHMHFEFPIY